MRLTVGGALLLNISIVAGCEAVLDLGPCRIYDPDHIDPISGLSDPCHELDRDAGTDAGEVDAGEGDAAGACPGECVPQGSNGWSPIPYLMWIGPKGQAPPCPGVASQGTYSGYGGLVVPDAACDSCACAPSAGSCEIPTGLTAYSAQGCNCSICPPGTIETPFDAPASWDGSCNTDTSIPADAQCGMPEVSCVQSISIDPLLIKEESCAVGVAPVPKQAYFELEARGCGASPQGVCENSSSYCLQPSDPFPGGFRHCVYTYDEEMNEPCPPEYPDGPHAFFKYMTDSRECACTCGSPGGSKCTASISIYQDSACAVPVFTDYMISSTAPDPCIDVVPGVALQSKAITNVSYETGTCEPKGELVGEVDQWPLFQACCTPEKFIP